MTLAEMHMMHQSLWRWITKNPCKSKSMWPGWKIFGYEKIAIDCFACEWVERKFGNECTDGSQCPLEWPGGSSCVGSGGLFTAWCNAERHSPHRKAIANLIANLPLKEKYR
jgi:hypothetical protein